jgi:hypothetical protein
MLVMLQVRKVSGITRLITGGEHGTVSVSLTELT